MNTQTTTQHPPVPAWTVGERLVKARESVNLTQQEMAEQLRVSRRSIVRYEASDDPPRPVVISWAAITGVPLWWFDGPVEGVAATTWYTALPLVAA